MGVGSDEKENKAPPVSYNELTTGSTFKAGGINSPFVYHKGN